MSNVISIDELLKMNIDIPGYQRPYMWSIQNISELFSDMTKAISDSEKYGSDFRYRIGTILLHENGCKYDIVDGQQRLISFILLKSYLDPSFDCCLLHRKFESKISQKNIHDNATFIREWFSLNSESKDIYNKSLSNVMEVVVLTVDKVEEAFQLFDSQNTRGRALDPHDLLKAYHLREMQEDPYAMEHAVTKWEGHDVSKIRDLFASYLYPIWNWARGIKSRDFSTRDIGTYKGVNENTGYTYAKRAGKAMPYFQITEPFLSGNDFFEFVDRYLIMLNDIKTELDTNSGLAEIKIIRDKYKKDGRINYVDKLFLSGLLCYYDKFHNFNPMAIKKIFLWAYMLRIDIDRVQKSSVNLYAIGSNYYGTYTNSIPMFSRICFARLHSEISELQINVLTDDTHISKEWNDLHNLLKSMSGITEVANDG